MQTYTISIKAIILALITISSTGCVINNYNDSSANKHTYPKKIQPLRKSLVFPEPATQITSNNRFNTTTLPWYKNRAYRFQPVATPSYRLRKQFNQTHSRTIDRQTTHNGRTNNYRSTTTITNKHN